MLIKRPYWEVTIVLAESETCLTYAGACIVSALGCVHSCMQMTEPSLRCFRDLWRKAYLFLYFGFVQNYFDLRLFVNTLWKLFSLRLSAVPGSSASLVCLLLIKYN